MIGARKNQHRSREFNIQENNGSINRKYQREKVDSSTLPAISASLVEKLDSLKHLTIIVSGGDEEANGSRLNEDRQRQRKGGQEVADEIGGSKKEALENVPS